MISVIFLLDEIYYLMDYKSYNNYRLCRKVEDAMPFFSTKSELFFEVCLVMLSRYEKIEIMKSYNQ